MNSTHAFFATKSKLNIKGLLALFALLLTMQSGWAQLSNFSETFEDGNITASPAWTGSLYTVNSTSSLVGTYDLRASTAGAVGNLYTSIGTSTNLASAGTLTWSFVFQDSAGNPGGTPATSTNGARIYLAINGTDPTASGVTGYALRYGNSSTPDPFVLVRTVGTGSAATETVIVSSGVDPSTTTYSVKVTRTAAGSWSIFMDSGTSGATTQKGASTSDTTYFNTGSANINFLLNTSNSTGTGNPNRFRFDNISFAVGGPTISTSVATLASAVNTTYGTASASPTSFTVSGTSMTAAGITVTPPSGYEVSQTSISSGYAGNGTAITVAGSGTIASTTIYVRLAANATVGSSPYTGNIVCSSTNATSVNVATVSSAVSKASSSITASGTTSFVYNGSAQGPASTSSVTGSAGAVTYAYSGVSPTVYSSSATAPTVVGTYQVIATVAADANYNTASSTAYAFAITKASSSITATGTTSFAYTGSAQGPASNTKSGSTGAVTYAYSGVSPTVYSSSATAPTVVGTYQVIATVAADANYNTASSTALPFSITATAPGVPTSVSAVGGDASAIVTFTAPVFNGGSAITTYTATSSPAGGTGSVSQSGSGTITVTGLTNGTAYTFSVTATNGASLTSSASTDSNSVTPSAGSTIPYAPTAVVITPTDGGLSVAFTAGNNGGSAITDYEYSTDNGSSFKSAGVVVSPVVISGLSNLSTYQVQIRAVNINGSGTATSSVSGTPGLVPDAPAISSITIGNAQLSVDFTAPTYTGGSAITSYQYSTDNGAHYITRQTGTTASPIVITTSSVDGTTALANGTTYTVLIKAVNGTGVSAASGSATGTPATTPGAPSISSITAGDASLTVNFTAGTTGGSALTTYKYSTDGGATFVTRTAGTTASPIIISTLSLNGAALSNGTSYDIKIKAVNAQGDGTATGTTAATPGTTPGAPTITGITPSNGQLSVAFNAPASNGGYAISNYQYSTNGGTTYKAFSSAETTSPLLITSVSTAATALVNGTSYTVLIKAVNSIGAGTASNSSTGTPALTNDLCTGATSITPGAAAIAGTTIGASMTTPFTDAVDVWYSFVATCSGTTTVNTTSSSSQDLDLFAFTTSCPASTTASFTGANSSSTSTETMSITAVAGTTYYVRVMFFGGTAGAFTISVTPPTPVTQAVTAQAATLVTGTTATLNGNLTAVGVCPSTSEKGFVYALTSANSDPQVSGTGVTKTTVSSIATGAYTLALTGLTAGTSYTFKSYVYDGSTYTYGAATSFTTLLAAPTVTAAVGASVDAAFSMTFTDNPAWRGAITGITVGGTALSASAYSTTSAGVLTFTPSAAALLQTSGSKTIAISATNYNVVSVTQAIAAGAATKLAVKTQPAAPASNGAVLATQPAVFLQDQYSNTSASTATVVATIGAGSWTIGGTTSKAGVSGTATFTDLTATSVAAVTGATITFTSSGLTPITSGTFNIISPDYRSIGALGTAVTENFDSMLTSNSATLPGGFKVNSNGATPDYSTGTSVVTGAAGTTGTGALTTSNSGAVFNFADGVTASATDRALGFLTAGSSLLSPNSIILKIANNTGSTIKNLNITFDYEKYRDGLRQNDWTFFHGSTTNPTTSATAGDLSYAASSGSNAVLNPATTISKTVSLTGLSIASGGIYYLKWTMTGLGGNSNSVGSGIDNFSITATAASTITVTGTTSFTYNGSAQGPSTSSVTGSTGSVSYSYVGVTGTTYGPTATKPTNAGSYTVTATVAADASYTTATSSALGFTIGKASSTVAVTGTTSFTYNATNQGPNTSDTTGSSGSVTYSYVGVSGTSYTASATPPTNAGSYEVTATLAADTNYNGATSSAVGFTIGQLTPTVTVTPIGTYTYNGLAQGPTASNTGGSAGSVTYSYEGASYSASATRPTNAGSYTVTASVAATTNFAAASSDATSFTIDKAVVTVTGDDKTKTYGDSNPSFTASYDGFVHSETLATSGITGTPSLSTLADASSTVGTYTISTGAGDLAASNYSFSYKDGTLTVVTKGLAITAANQSKCFGSSLSLGTTAFTTSDMVSGDSVSSVSLSSTGTAVDASTGTYAITGSSASGTGLSNYAISYTDGTLTVNALPTATIGGNLTMCQNGTSPVVTFTGANGTAPYTFSYTINGGSTLTVSTTSGNSATVSVPTTTAGSFVYSLVSVQDSSTTACSQTQTGTATVTFNTSSIYYADADGDGYGNLKVTSAPLCAAPAGYVANSTDCDDTNAAINPGQSEVAGDGIDNNCDGRVDEAGVTTKVVASVCGTTLGSLNSPIYVNLVSSPVVGYRYEVSYGSPATVRVYDTTANNIILSNVVSPVYNTAYSIRVSVKTTQSNGDYWQAYGASCTVTTPAPPTTKLIPSLCGATLTSLYTNIYCGAVPLVTSYKFSVTDSNGVERVKITSTPVFNLMQFPSTPSYGVCSIKVAVLYNGVWQDYGTPCSLTTVVPTTQLVSTLCGTALTAIDFPLYATAVNQATAYQFEVSTGGSVVGSYTSSTNVFNLLQITGILYNTTYSVRVAPVCNGTTQAFGTSCSITTPTIVTTQLVASTCGTSLTSLYAPLYANAVPLATGYRFEVKNGATLVGTYDASSNVFNLMQVGVTSSTTYSVRVAVIYNGTAQGYGSTCTVTTPTLGVAKLLPALCGSTLTSLYAPLSCNAVTLATGYEFEVSDGVTTRTYDATSNQFNLMQLSGGAEYSTTYTVRVAPIISGVVQAFGASCTVTTLAIPTTTVVASRCGTTLTSLYAPIYANAVKLATGYAFKVIDNATGLQVGSTYSSSSNVFNLKQVSGTDKGKSYSISVAVQYNGLYQGFGTPCTVNTAANAAVRMSDETLASVFTVKAYPNPFANSFNLAIESESDEVISVQVYDMIGRELEARKATVSELSTQELGNNYPSGVYNIIVSQGDQVKTLRMIKR